MLLLVLIFRPCQCQQLFQLETHQMMKKNDSLVYRIPLDDFAYYAKSSEGFLKTKSTHSLYCNDDNGVLNFTHIWLIDWNRNQSSHCCQVFLCKRRKTNCTFFSPIKSILSHWSGAMVLFYLSNTGYMGPIWHSIFTNSNTILTYVMQAFTRLEATKRWWDFTQRQSLTSLYWPTVCLGARLC